MQYKTGSVLKGYTIKEYINKGGFGDVYSAHQPTISRDVAIKVILPQYANTPDFIKHFEAEAQVIARLEHPYIVPLYDYWRDADGAYLVMRLLKGGSLKDLIQQQGAFSLEEIASILDQLCQALHIAHRNNIIHRDIKPGNILLDEDGNAYLADFGIAKDHTISDDVTDPDGVVGSPDYLAPEQARAEPVTPRTDIYSLGVILYEMLVGEHPFPNLNSIERLFKHLNEPLPDLMFLNVEEQIRHDLNEVIQKATAKNPDHRYDDVFALTQAFKDAAQLTHMPTSISLVELLTPREQEVLKMLIDGKTNRQIAEVLVVEISTVKSHNSEIYRKLKVKNRRQAIVKARHIDLIIADSASLNSVDIDNLPEPENPYKGLQAFQAPDSHLFFGREKFTDKLLKRLQEDVAYKRFLAVVGPSGSGKSSVVKAGLIPQIWRGAFPSSDSWYIVDMLPGKHPLDELEIALTRIATDNKVNLHEQLERDERGLLRTVDMILPDDGSELLLVIDQFEEVFTQVEDEQQRQHFLNLLQTAITTPRSRVHVVVTLRADYYDKPLQYPEFGEILRNRIETILPLGAQELERTIREPAQNVGVTFEDGLVSRIVADVHYQPGALPLLQYALTELFERRDGRVLTQKAYTDIGGTGGALANRADELFREYDTDGQELIRQMFLRLVTLGEGAEDTRRRADRAELLTITDNSDLMNDIIDSYAESRLLSLDHDPATRQPTVEVAHEAILREWDRLRAWLNDSRDDIRQERLIAQAAWAWKDHNRDKSYLLTGSRLEQAEQWQESTQIALTPLESEFIHRSISRRESDNQAETERQARETSLEKRSRNFLWGLVSVFVIATILSGGFGIFALIQRNQAVEALDIAQRSGLALAAGDAMDVNEVDLAVALALESVGDDEANMLQETRRILERIENQAGPRIWRTNDGFSCNSRQSRDYRYFLWPDCQSSISVWDTLTAEKLGDMTMPEPFDFTRNFVAEFSNDGSRLLIAQPDPFLGIVDLVIIDMETWEIVASYTTEEPVLRIYFAADSSMIATMETTPENLTQAREEGKNIGDSISLRVAETGEIIRKYRFDNQWIQGFNLSRDGKLGVVYGWSGWDGPTIDDYRAIIFDMDTGDILHTFDRPHNENIATSGWNSAFAGFNIDGTKLFMSGFPNYLIDIATGEDYSMITQLEGGPIDYPDLDFQYVMNRDSNNAPQLFHIETGEVQKFDVNFAYLTAQPGTMLTLDLGRMDEFQIWDIAGRSSNTNNVRQTSEVSAVQYSPDGRQVVVANSGWGCIDIGNQNNAIYDTETMEVVGQLDGDRNMAHALDWSPDGRYIASGTLNEAILWDATTGAEIRRFIGTQDCVMRLKFSHDGHYLYGAHGSWFPSPNYEVPPYLVQWDVETGEEVQRFEFPVDESPNWGVIGLALHPTRNLATVAITTRFMEGCEQGSCDFESYILDLDSGEVTALAEPMISIGFALEGAVILGYGIPNIIYVADAESGEILRQWNTLDSQNFATAISPDGRYLNTGAGPLAFESGISQWDIETGELVRRYFSERQQTFIIQMDFHPDGTQFVSSAYEPVVRFWDVDTRSTADWVRENRVVRDFTCVEREQYRISPLCEAPE